MPDQTSAAPQTFRSRLRSSELLAGRFVKTPTGHASEIPGDLGFDSVVIDADYPMPEA